MALASGPRSESCQILYEKVLIQLNDCTTTYAAIDGPHAVWTFGGSVLVLIKILIVKFWNVL